MDEMNRNFKIENSKLKSGFTLIEALVAVSILMIAIASPMTLAQKGLSTATLSKDQMIAAFLVQDGIEALKNIRDQIAIRGTGANWLDILQPCICYDAACNFDSAVPKFCTIDTTSLTWDSNSIKLGGTANTGLLKISYDISSNFLKYDYNNDINSNNYSKFTRYINIKSPVVPSGDSNEAVVSVRVFWDSDRGVREKVEAQDFIYNYSDNF